MTEDRPRLRDRLRDAIWELDFAGLSEQRDEIPEEYDSFVDIALNASRAKGGEHVAANAIAATLSRDWNIRLSASQVRATSEAIRIALE